MAQIHDGMNMLERAYLLSLDYPITAVKAPATPNKHRRPKLIMVDAIIELMDPLFVIRGNDHAVQRMYYVQ